MRDIASSVIQYCTDIGRDPLLVQGAGGNVSWKDGSTLWIKASGTWLADAATKNIFVPVDLDDLQKSIARGDFSVKPTLTSSSDLKPSIETLLHALMPHPVVVHLHAIEVLALLVRSDCDDELAALSGIPAPWVIVDYFNPGSELARAVRNVLDRHCDAKVVFLKNHGLVVGGADVDEIRQTINTITRLFRARRNAIMPPDATPPAPDAPAPINGYVPIADSDLHRLACDARLFTRLASGWAIYPDHVVFLGAAPNLFDSLETLKDALSRRDKLPELVFVRGIGVFVAKTFSQAKSIQLRCYYDVITRQPESAALVPILHAQVHDLLNRDDEKYRMSLAKK